MIRYADGRKNPHKELKNDIFDYSQRCHFFSSLMFLVLIHIILTNLLIGYRNFIFGFSTKNRRN